MQKKLLFVFFTPLFMLSFYLLAGCTDSKKADHNKTSISSFKKTTKGEITFIIRNAPAVYYEGPFGKEGFEYDLAKNFADYLGKELKLYVTHDIEETIKALKEGKGEVAAASITMTKQRKKDFIFGPSYLNVNEIIICNRNIKNIEDFAPEKKHTLVVPAKTSYQETLEKLSKEHNITYTVTPNSSTEEIMFQIERNNINCTVSDSNLFKINRRYYPNINKRFALNKEQPIGWMLRDTEVHLQEKITQWFRQFKKSGKFRNMVDKYYDFSDDFDYVDNIYFIRKIRSELPKYEKYFKEAGAKYNIPWQFLAAVSYKESHWNPDATSPTGVRGMMMLTSNTAKSLGVANRLDPKESIFGGAKYIEQLMQQMPEEITKLDLKSQYMYTMVAYNIGIAHLKDALGLAKKLGKDPYNWTEFSEIVPKLSSERYYKSLPYGYANGIGAQIYVNQLIDYYDILIDKKSHLPKRHL